MAMPITTEMILQPLLAGLAVGAFCLSYCFPFMGAYLAAEDRPLRKHVQIVAEFLLGRLLGYLGFGLAAGYLGRQFDSSVLRLATSISFVLLSLIMFLHLTGLIRRKKILCGSLHFLKNKSPVLMGFLMGINLCPPFLLSVAYIFKQQSPFYGMVYFALFFLSSSIYFLPLVLVGLLARVQEFRLAGRLSGYAVAGIFLVYGFYSFFHNSL